MGPKWTAGRVSTSNGGIAVGRAQRFERKLEGLVGDAFARVFGGCDWAVMFVLARSGKTYARLRFNVGPCGDAVIPVEVDFTCPFGASDHEAWAAEYDAHIHAAWEEPVRVRFLDDREDLDGLSLPDDWLDDLEEMEPVERQFVLAELAGREDPWYEETEAVYADSHDR